MKTAAIVNPVSGWKTAGRRWPELLAALGPGASEVRTLWTGYPGHAEVLAAEARRSGYERVIAVGGDGTLFEVLNGLWWEKKGELPSVGMLPLGTGCDYIRNFQVGRSRLERLRAAVGPHTIKVSLGRCRVQGREKRERVFAMILGLGLDAEVVRLFRCRASVPPSGIAGGTPFYPLAGDLNECAAPGSRNPQAQALSRRRPACPAWPAYAMDVLKASLYVKPYVLSGKVDDVAFGANAVFFAAALGCFFGKRIVIAPRASPGLGRFELIWVEPVGFFGRLAVLLSAYFGAHCRLPGVRRASGSRMVLHSDPQAWVQADGELIGRTPLEIEIVPEAISFAASAEKRA